jgi:spore coat protein U-like protein
MSAAPHGRSRWFPWLGAAGILCALILGSGRADAACTIRIETTVVFGNYNVFTATPLDSTGRISYRCANSYTVPIRITITRGNSPTYTPRQMQQGANILQYNLFLDAGRLSIWGDGTGGTSYYSYTPPSGTRIYLWVYGRVPALQDAAVGNYTDRVTVVINY